MAQLFGSERVGGKVAYVNGQFYTPWYRHYRIKGSYKDDFSFMYEVVIRRLQDEKTDCLTSCLLMEVGNISRLLRKPWNSLVLLYCSWHS